MAKDTKDNAIKRRCVKLAHEECANYVRGLCVDPDRYEECECDCINHYTVMDGAINCDYFLLCVLPLDKELNELVWAEIHKAIEDEREAGKHQCALCGKWFVPGSNRQKYCMECGYKADRKNRAKRARKRRTSGKAQ